MLFLQLLADGLVSGLAVGLVAISFSLIYSTTRTFHVAHAGLYTLGGYIAWYATEQGVPFAFACLLAVAGTALAGGQIQHQLYARLERRKASPLVMLIASLGALAILQNLIAITFTANILSFSNTWRLKTLAMGPVALSYAQVLTAVASLAAFAGLIWFTRNTPLGRRIRAVSSNPLLAEITRLRPATVAVQVMMIASGVVAIPGALIGLDQAMQPYTGVLVLLTATIAMIAGGIGSLTGAFVVSIVLSVLQTLSLVVMSGRWAIAATFGLFIVFILIKPEGLFRRR
jgi:branched-chain amino acid transport system permease protein